MTKATTTRTRTRTVEQQTRLEEPQEAQGEQPPHEPQEAEQVQQIQPPESEPEPEPEPQQPPQQHASEESNNTTLIVQQMSTLLAAMEQRMTKRMDDQIKAMGDRLEQQILQRLTTLGIAGASATRNAISISAVRTNSTTRTTTNPTGAATSTNDISLPITTNATTTTTPRMSIANFISAALTKPALPPPPTTPRPPTTTVNTQRRTKIGIAGGATTTSTLAPAGAVTNTGVTVVVGGYAEFSYDGRRWDVPETFEFPYKIPLKEAFRLWVEGLPDYRYPATTTTMIHAPIRPFSRFTYERLPKRMYDLWRLHWCHVMEAICDAPGVTPLPNTYASKTIMVANNKIPDAVFDALYEQAFEYFKTQRVSYVFNDEKKTPHKWKLLTWARHVTPAMIRGMAKILTRPIYYHHHLL